MVRSARPCAPRSSSTACTRSGVVKNTMGLRSVMNTPRESRKYSDVLRLKMPPHPPRPMSKNAETMVAAPAPRQASACGLRAISAGRPGGITTRYELRGHGSSAKKASSPGHRGASGNV